MYKIEGLKSKGLFRLKEINDKRKIFNALNEDFFQSYYNNENSLFKKFVLLKNVKVIYFNEDVVGYVWYEKLHNKHYILKSISFIEKAFFQEGTKYFLENFRPGNIFTYNCEKNDFNFSILEALKFMKEEDTLDLLRKVDKIQNIYLPQDISIEKFIAGKHEKLRCKLQNSIFQCANREPITIDDIIFDIKQDYYIEGGSVFIKYMDEYIGYGQLIIDEGEPTIVNFGIIKDYRNKGYADLLLKYIINIVYSLNYFEVKIKVYSENTKALNLYIKNGFKKFKENGIWNYITQK
jgi:ribosomal protein S18 acetylase RimI-like enzyme